LYILKTEISKNLLQIVNIYGLEIQD